MSIYDNLGREVGNWLVWYAPYVRSLERFTMAPQDHQQSKRSAVVIDRDADAVVEFHDMLGRKVAILPRVSLTAGSSFQYIPASSYRSLAPGLYQLTITTADARAQRRIVLVR